MLLMNMNIELKSFHMNNNGIKFETSVGALRKKVENVGDVKDLLVVVCLKL